MLAAFMKYRIACAALGILVVVILAWPLAVIRYSYGAIDIIADTENSLIATDYALMKPDSSGVKVFYSNYVGPFSGGKIVVTTYTDKSIISKTLECSVLGFKLPKIQDSKLK